MLKHSLCSGQMVLSVKFWFVAQTAYLKALTVLFPAVRLLAVAAT